MNQLTYLRTLRRRWATVAACVLISLPIGWVLAQAGSSSRSREESTYRATTYLEPAYSESTLYDVEDGLEGIATRAVLGQIPQRTMAAVNFRQSQDEFERQIEVTADGVADLLVVTATNPLAPQAVRMADAFAEQIVRVQDEEAAEQLADIEAHISEARAELRGLRRQAQDNESVQLRDEIESAEARLEGFEEQRTLHLGGATAELSVWAAARAELVTESTGLGVPASPGARMGIAILLGLIAGVALALVRERMDPRIQDRDQAEEVFDLPVLAEVPKSPRRHRGSVVVTAAPGAPASNAYQLLAAGLLFGRHRADAPPVAADQPPAAKTLLVTSALGSEGRTSVVANLAAAFAGVGKRVIVISSAFGDRGASNLLGSVFEPGLADVLDDLNEVEPEEAVHDSNLALVRMIPAGRERRPSAGRSLLSSDRLDAVLRDSAANADIVVIDVAPVLASSDWSMLVPKVDGVVIVARAGTTPWAAAERTADLLKMLQAPCLGVVLNDLPLSAVRQAGYWRESLGREPEPVSTVGQEGDAIESSAGSPVVIVDGNGNGARTSGDGAHHAHVHPHRNDD